MDLFSLVAKLTLDTKEYTTALTQAKTDANIELEDPSLGLDKSDFDSGIRDAENTDVDDPEDPNLGLNKTPFDTEVTDAENTDVDDPEDPELDLDKSKFDSTVSDAEETDVSDPADPSLGLDTSEFRDGVDEAEALGDGFAESMSSVFAEIKGALTAAGITGMVVGFVNFFKEGIDLAKENGDAIDKQRQKLNLSAKAYQELDYAMTLSGSSITELTRSMRNFTSIAGGKITDEQAAAFEALGISATNASGEFKTAEQIMEESLYALADYGGSDRGALAEALFGRNSASLNALFNAGSAKIKEMREEANELGFVMSDEEISNAASYMDATTRLEKAIVSIKEEFASGLIPLLTDAANTTAKIIAFFNPRTQGNSLSDAFSDTNEQLSKDLASIEGTAGAATDLIDKLFSMGEAEKLTAEQQAEWKETADWLIKNIPSLSDVIDKDTLKITANKDEVASLIDKWRTLSQERAIASAKEAKYKAMLDTNADAIDKQAEARAKENDALAKQYERIATANQLLADNQDLADQFYGVFGTDTIDKDAENLGNMLAWIRNVGYEFADTTQFEKLTGEYTKLITEADNARKEAESYKDQLEKAEKEYEAWMQAIEELYGTTGTEAEDATSLVEGLATKLEGLPREINIAVNLTTDSNTPGSTTPEDEWTWDDDDLKGFSQAKGDWYVPYDDYPSSLHRGEMVLTASEARRYRDGDTGSSSLDGLEDRIVAAISRGMATATVRTYINGRDITDEVNRRNSQDVKARRFAT